MKGKKTKIKKKRGKGAMAILLSFSSCLQIFGFKKPFLEPKKINEDDWEAKARTVKKKKKNKTVHTSEKKKGERHEASKLRALF